MITDLNGANCVGKHDLFDCESPSATKYKNGCRCSACRHVHMVAHKRWKMGLTGQLIDGTGTRRRIQALAALGWTLAEIGEACGANSRQWACEVVRSPMVHTNTAARVSGAYERLSMTVPVGNLRHRGRVAAAKKGWPPPLAWTNIDDPDEIPHGWQRATDDWIAELYDLDDQRVGISAALARLGVSRKSLQKRCERHDLMPIYSRLVAREQPRCVSNQFTAGGAA